jgi:hypothetical protein
MKKVFIILFAFALFTSLISAEIIITQQPNEIYYAGQTLKFPVKITSQTELNDFLKIELICDGKTTEFHREFISIGSGEELVIKTTVPLIKQFMGKTSAICKTKTILGTDYVLSNEFEVKDKLTIDIVESEIQEVSPLDIIMIKGTVSKENMEEVKGYVELEMKNGEETIKIQDTVINGNFNTEFQIPKNAKAGSYQVKINVYEKDYLGEKTTNGKSTYSFRVLQIPTNLELILNGETINPKSDLEMKPILHDQTGENIDSLIKIQIKNSEGKLIDEKEIESGETYSYYVQSNEAPNTWKIESTYNEFVVSQKIKINAKQEIETEIINKTLIVRNKGNVPFNKTIEIKIGDTIKEIKLDLGVNQEEFYLLSAPEGTYDIEVSTGEQNQVTTGVLLTGNAIDVKKASQGIVNFVGKPIVWIFLIIVIGVVAYIVYKKGYRKSFFGYIYKKKKEETFEKSKEEIKPQGLTDSAEKAKFSLSIKGNKQDATIICLKIKNEKEILEDKTNSKSTLQQLTHIASKEKVATYENGNTLLFIFAPAKTKTFDNEKPAIELAEKMKKILDHHNKLFKQKINYGISINKGTIVAKQEKNILLFSVIGNFTAVSKKVASISKQEILITEPIKEKLIRDVVTTKHNHENLTYYSINEVKDNSEKREVVNDLLRRMQKS